MTTGLNKTGMQQEAAIRLGSSPCVKWMLFPLSKSVAVMTTGICRSSLRLARRFFFQEIGEIIHAQQTFLAGMDFGQVDERLAGKKLHDFERFSPVSNKGTGNRSCTGARKYVRTDVVFKESLQHTQVSNSPDKTAAQCESCMIFQCGHRLSINRRAGGAAFSAAAVCMLIRF